MAKTTAPLLSFGASGQIAQTQVYSKWKGRAYARRYTVPANPNTTEQQLTRSVFSWLQAVYKFATPDLTDAWEAYAKGLVMTARNAFTKLNLSQLRTAADLTTMLFSPGALGGLPGTAIVVAGSAGHIAVTLTAPTSVPVGWTITSAILGVIRQQDPNTGALYQIATFEDVATPFTNSFVTAAGVYVGFGFFKWLRPDGRTAYSVSLSGVGTAT